MVNVTNETAQDPNAVQNVTNNMLNNSTIGASNQATLILFSPRYIPNVFSRPLTYRFGDEFMNDITNVLEQSQNSAFTHDNSFMLGTHSATSAVLPRAVGDEIHLESFRDMWTFVIIVDSYSPTLFNHRSNACSRMIYSGFIIDEPVSNMGMQKTLNPHAVLNITHHLRLASFNQALNMNGACSRICTTGNWSYADPTVATQIRGNGTGGAVYSLQPENLATSVRATESPYAYYGEGTFLLDNAPINATARRGRSMNIASSLESPAHHLARVVEGFKTSVQSVREYQNDYATYPGASSILQDAAYNWGMGTNLVVDQLEPDHAYSMQEVLGKYPNLNVTVIRQPSQQLVGLTDAGAPSKRNVMSAIVSSTLPFLMGEEGIADVAFRYDSFNHNTLMSSDMNQGAFELMNISMLYACEPAQIQAAWSRLYSKLQWALFKIIKDNAGDFSLLAYCSLNGSTLVDLQLHDVMTGNQDFVETSNLLGGLNTNTVGSQHDATGNALQMYNVATQLSNYTSGTNTPVSVTDLPF